MGKLQVDHSTNHWQSTCLRTRKKKLAIKFLCPEYILLNLTWHSYTLNLLLSSYKTFFELPSVTVYHVELNHLVLRVWVEYQTSIGLDMSASQPTY